MPTQPPVSIPILRDDYHAEFIGKTKDGRQFMLTTPFTPARKEDPGCEFLALYTFDPQGRFLAAVIDNLGPRAGIIGEDRDKLRDKRLAELGEKQFGDIRVQPFKTNRFGVEFGLIAREPEDEGDHWWLEFHPGNFMAFTEPWDGTYDT